MESESRSFFSRINNILPHLTFALVTIVILWGAFVRVTHSGAGCGKNWPLCKGEILVLNPQIDTLIEQFHRLSSGLSFLLVLTCYLIARRSSSETLFRKSAFWSLVFITSEALIGASLVLFGWVKDNSTSTRAIVVAFHLINSFLLLFSLAIHSYSSVFFRDFKISYRDFYTLFKPVFIIVVLFLLVACSGAITALGDTLFPNTSVIEGLRSDLSPNSHFLIRLRTIHPFLAMILALIMFLYFSQSTSSTTKRIKMIGVTLVIMQVCLGSLNVLLLAPSYLQILHLFVSILLWTALTWSVMQKIKVS